MPQLPELLTTSEVAEMLRTSSETVRRWAASGQIDAIPLPSGQYRIRRAVVDAILSGETAQPAEVGA
jgi:excisionase family DNA binding protein